MSDTANLRVRVSSSGVDTTERSLDQFASTADRADNTVNLLQKSLLGLGAGVSLAALTQQLSSAVLVTAEFTKSISNLSAITGAVGDDLLFLSDASKEFGSSTTLSATQAAEAFKLVASARPDLLQNVVALKAVTQEAIVLAEAAGITLPEAATALTSSLTLFGIAAEDSARAINVLAAGAKEGSSEIRDTTAALKDAGLIANQAGLSFEEANGAVQGLAKGLIRGSEAGTALRNIFTILESQADSQLKPSVVGLSQALENLNTQGFQETSKAVKLFGRENISAGQTLIKFRGEVDRVTQAVTGTDEAYRQASVNVDNLAGDLLGLGSAFEATQIRTGEFLDEGLRAVTQELTTLLQALSGNEEALEVYGSAIETTTDILTILSVVIGTRLVISLTASATAFAVSAVAATRATITTNAYGQVLARTTVTSNLLTAATTTLSRAMGLLGGPVGIAITVATALAVFSTSGESARQTAKDLTDQLDNLTDGFENFNDAQRSVRVSQLNQELGELYKTQLSLQTQYDELVDDGVDWATASIDAQTGLLDKQDEVSGALKETKTQINLIGEALQRIFNAGLPDITGEVEPVTTEVNNLDVATNKLIKSLQQQLEVSKLTGKEAAQLRAEYRAGESATADQVAQVRQLSGALFDQQEVTKEATKSAQELAREKERLVAIEDQVLEGLTGVTSATMEQRTALESLAEQGRITGEQLREGLLAVGGEEGTLNFAEAYENQLNQMEEATANSAQILGEQFAQIFGPGGTLITGLADATAHAIVFGESGSEAVKQVATTIATQLLSAVIQYGIQQAITAATGQASALATISTTSAAALASQAAITAGSVAAASASAIAWAPAAALASLATIGTNAAPAIAAITATTAAASVASAGTSFAGFFANGGNIPAGQTGIAGEAGLEFVNGPANITSAKDTRKALENSGNSQPVINFEVINQSNARVSQPQVMDDGTVRMLIRKEVPNLMAKEVKNERSPFNKASNNKYVQEKR